VTTLTNSAEGGASSATQLSFNENLPLVTS
jgi:hypothetical protein